MKRPELISLGVSALVLAALGSYVALHFAITTDVSELLPPDADRELLAITRRVADSELGRTMVLLLGAADVEQLVPASRDFEAALRAEPRVHAQLASLGIPAHCIADAAVGRRAAGVCSRVIGALGGRRLFRAGQSDYCCAVNANPQWFWHGPDT